MLFQLVGRTFRWMTGGYIFWFLQALLIKAAVYTLHHSGEYKRIKVQLRLLQ